MVSIELLVSLVPFVPLLGFLLVAFNPKRFSEGIASVIACGTILISFIISIILFINVTNIQDPDKAIHVTLFNWITTGNFSATLSFLVDPLSVLMMLIITGVGFLIHVYSIGYMHGDAGFNLSTGSWTILLLPIR